MYSIAMIPCSDCATKALLGVVESADANLSKGKGMRGLGGITLEMLRDLGPALRQADIAQPEAIARTDDGVDNLEAAILAYLGKLRRGLMSEHESLEFQLLMTATTDFESLADVIETDIVALGRKAARFSGQTGDETRQMLLSLYEATLAALELTVKAVRDKNQQAAESVVMMKNTLRDQAARLLGRKAERLSAEATSTCRWTKTFTAPCDLRRRTGG